MRRRAPAGLAARALLVIPPGAFAQEANRQEIRTLTAAALNRTTGIPATVHSSDSCELSEVEARMMPSTRYCISWSNTGSESRSLNPVNSSTW